MPGWPGQSLIRDDLLVDDDRLEPTGHDAGAVAGLEPVRHHTAVEDLRHGDDLAAARRVFDEDEVHDAVSRDEAGDFVCTQFERVEPKARASALPAKLGPVRR